MLAFAMGAWNVGWFLTFVTVMIYHFGFGGASDEFWETFWHTTILIQVVISVPTTIWFTIGGYQDIRALFNNLRNARRDPTDDGRVIHSPEDYAPEPQPELVPAIPQGN